MSANVSKAANVNAARLATNSSNGVQGNGASSSNASKSNRTTMIIIIVVTILLFVFVILYITFALKSKNLKGKALVATPVRLDRLESNITIPSASIPKATVGREFTYSFWLYLDQFNKETTAGGVTPVHKLIMYRGNPNDAASANPLVMMDGLSNKLYVIIKTTESSIASSTVNNNLNEILEKNYFITNASLEDPTVNKHLIMTIDYVPLQRWVNVAAVIDNKVLTLYLDGEIYSVKSTDEYKSARQPYVTRLGKVVPYNLIVEKTDGDLIIGRDVVGNRRTINGFISKVEFFNYALTMNQVKQNYITGPMPRSWLAMIGLSQYGFRSPLYKLNQTVQ